MNIREMRRKLARRKRTLHRIEHMLTMVVGSSVCLGYHVAEVVASGGIAVLMVSVIIAGEEEL